LLFPRHSKRIHRQDDRARLTVSMTTGCCAECGEEGGVSLKTCKACMHARYCSAACQRKHWPKHKKDCKIRAVELRDEALFKDPPAKEDCPICFLPMPARLICCISLPPATISSVPIYDFGIAHEEMADEAIELYYPCCGKSICKGCIHSFGTSGNIGKCPFCNSDRNNTEEERVQEMMRQWRQMTPLQLNCWLILITRDRTVFNRIRRRQWSFTLGQQILVVVMRILNWVAFIIKGEI